MADLVQAAVAAQAQREAAKEAEREQERENLIAVARAAFDEVMRTPDDKVPVQAKDLTVEHVDVAAGIVVLADDEGLHLSYREGEFTVVTPPVDGDGRWTRHGPPVTSLAELGDVLSAEQLLGAPPLPPGVERPS